MINVNTPIEFGAMKVESADQETLELLEYVTRIKNQKPDLEVSSLRKRNEEPTIKHTSNFKAYQNFMASINCSRKRIKTISDLSQSTHKQKEVESKQIVAKTVAAAQPVMSSSMGGGFKQVHHRLSTDPTSNTELMSSTVPRFLEKKRISHVQIEFQNEVVKPKPKERPKQIHNKTNNDSNSLEKSIQFVHHPTAFSSKLQKKLKIKQRFRKKIIDQFNKHILASTMATAFIHSNNKICSANPNSSTISNSSSVRVGNKSRNLKPSSSSALTEKPSRKATVTTTSNLQQNETLVGVATAIHSVKRISKTVSQLDFVQDRNTRLVSGNPHKHDHRRQLQHQSRSISTAIVGGRQQHSKSVWEFNTKKQFPKQTLQQYLSKHF